MGSVLIAVVYQLGMQIHRVEQSPMAQRKCFHSRFPLPSLNLNKWEEIKDCFEASLGVHNKLIALPTLIRSVLVSGMTPFRGYF